MPKRPTITDLQGLRTWALAIQRWQNDGAQTLAQHELSWGGFDTLLVLLDGPLRPGEVTARIGFTTGGMAKLLKSLEDEGLLERRRGEHEDLRAVTVELTAAGKQKVRDAGADVLAIREFDYCEWEISTESQRNLTQVWEQLAGRTNDRPPDPRKRTQTSQPNLRPIPTRISFSPRPKAESPATDGRCDYGWVVMWLAPDLSLPSHVSTRALRNPGV